LLCAIQILAAEFLLASPSQTVVEIRCHGNYSIPDEEVLRIAGVSPGLVIEDSGLTEIKDRLYRSRRFEWVDVSTRSRTLAATDQVILVITVKEKQGVASKFMVWPILSGSDEFGLSYGARLTAENLLGARERISIPLTWGGIRRAEVESEIGIPRLTETFFIGGGGIHRRENPHFDIGDLRREVWGGARKRFRYFQLDWRSGWTAVDFGSWSEDFASHSGGLVLDTRQDLNFPRNAVYTGFSWERISITGNGPSFNRYKADLRGYLGLWGRSILAAQFMLHTADGRLPDYQRPFLGGATTLRGHKPGAFIGDNIALAAVELRMPMTSPMKPFHGGMVFFLDTGAVYDHGRSLRNASFKNGAGIGFFLFVAGFGLKVDVAHDTRSSVRLHFSTSFRY
jgi:outer membrane protein assembly factor BamA